LLLSLLYKIADRRDIAAMYDEKMPWHEIVSDTIKLIESLKDNERKMAIGAIAGHFDMAVVKNPTNSGSGYRKPYPTRK
jgi:hypothetical protein